MVGYGALSLDGVSLITVRAPPYEKLHNRSRCRKTTPNCLSAQKV